MTAKQKAVFYARASSSKQEDSVASQLDIDLPYFAQLYDIVETYTDDGISASGDDSKRAGYQRMIADLSGNIHGQDSLIICVRESSRFSRQDPYAAAVDKAKLINAGHTILHSRSNGIINWREQAGQILDIVQASADNQYSRSLAKNALNGKIRLVQSGCHAGSPIPYGYCKQYTKQNGETEIVKRGEKASRPKNWTAKLILGEPCEVEAVRYLYLKLSHADYSLRQLARLMAEKTGSNWERWHVEKIIRNPVYAGGLAIGITNKCKHYRHVNGQAVEKSSSEKSKPTINWGACEAIVDRETWEAVQVKYNRGKHVPKKDRVYIFSGMVRCGHCGWLMQGSTDKRGIKRYQCTASKNRTASTCKCWMFREDEFLKEIAQKLLTVCGEQVVREMAIKPEPTSKIDTGRIEAQIEKLTTKINNANRRIIEEEDDSLIAGYRAALKELIGERDSLKAKLEEANQPKDWMEEAKQRLNWWTNREAVFIKMKEWSHATADRVITYSSSAPIDPAVFRNALKELGTQITLFFQPGQGKRKWEVAKGIVEGQLFGELSNGVASSKAWC